MTYYWLAWSCRNFKDLKCNNKRTKIRAHTCTYNNEFVKRLYLVSMWNVNSNIDESQGARQMSDESLPLLERVLTNLTSRQASRYKPWNPLKSYVHTLASIFPEDACKLMVSHLWKLRCEKMYNPVGQHVIQKIKSNMISSTGPHLDPFTFLFFTSLWRVFRFCFLSFCFPYISHSHP